LIPHLGPQQAAIDRFAIWLPLEVIGVVHEVDVEINTKENGRMER
jgi:hypothetical protein